MKKIFCFYIIFTLLFLCGCSKSVKPLPPIETAKIGTMIGSTNELLAQKKYPQADIQRFNNYVDESAALLANKLDYAMIDYSTAWNYTKNYKELCILPEKLTDEKTSIALKKENKELNRKINEVLNRFISDGTVDEIISHWFKEDGSDYKIVEVPKIADGPVLKVAVTTLSEPRCFVKDGKIIGMNVELIDKIAYEMGMKAEYHDMELRAMVDSLKSGKSDIVAAMYETPERAKSVDFTAGYFSNPQVLLVRKDRAGGLQNKTSGDSITPNNSMLLSEWASSLKDSFIKTFVVENRYKLILQGLWTTMVISMLSVLFGSLFGALICAMRRSRARFLSVIAKVYIRLIQGVPIVLILMILYYILFANVDIGPVLIAIVGFSINFAAYSSEIFRTAIEATDKGQLEAAYALGFSKYQSFLKITLPQALRHIIPIYKGEFVSTVKMTSVVGYIAIQDLTKMSDIIRSRTFDAFFPLFVTAFIYFIITYLFIFVLGRIELHIDPKQRKRVVKGIVQPDGNEGGACI